MENKQLQIVKDENYIIIYKNLRTKLLQILKYQIIIIKESGWLIV